MQFVDLYEHRHCLNSQHTGLAPSSNLLSVAIVV